MGNKERQAEKLRKLLRKWGNTNTRHYPWRWIDDPYAILVAEFMLHRTQAKQVMPIYERFMQTYPTLKHYADANKSEVEMLLSSLGLHWRIAGMMNALTEIWNLYRHVPSDPAMLISVRGIGQYIANATYCFTQNHPVALVDTNTVRVIGRVFGLDLSGEARRRKSVIRAIAESCDPDRPRDHYYAMIDLAHSVCTPQKPDCTECPLLDIPCEFGNQQTPNIKD